jgi:2-methylcitrate dehydratase PrpD
MVKEVDKVLRVGVELSDYIATLSYGDLHEDVVHQAKRVILDSLGTMYMGVRKEEAAGVSKFLKGLGATPECTVIGAGFKTSLPWAAFANASHAQVHDCNDGHMAAAAWGGSSHPGRVAIPTALAVGEKLGASGRDVITAIVIGYDVATRLRGMKERPPLRSLLLGRHRRQAHGARRGRVPFRHGDRGLP